MLLDLVVSEFKHLQTIREGTLSSPGIGEVVNDFLVSEGLLNVLVCKIHDHVSIGMGLSLHAVGKNNFLLAALVNTLDFAVMPYDLIDHLLILYRLIVVFLR